jgi:hypothetical protein
MRRHVIAAALAASFLGLGTAPVQAAFVTSAQLLDHCEKGAAGALDQMGLCLGFIAGVHDDLSAMEELGAINMVFCPVPTVSLDELRATVVAYLRRNKADGQVPAIKLAVNAMVERFPCKSAK